MFSEMAAGEVEIFHLKGMEFEWSECEKNTHHFQALLFLNEHLEKADTICTLLSLGYRRFNSELSLVIFSSQGQVKFG